MGWKSSATPSALSSTAEGPIASSPIRLARKPPPTTTLSVSSAPWASGRARARRSCRSPPADHDALGVLPALGLQENADHRRQLLRELLDRAVHQAGRF